MVGKIIVSPIITLAAWLVLAALKQFFSENKIFKKLIPILAGVIGAGLGILFYYCFRDMMNTENVIWAIVSGLVSGLLATGANELVKNIMEILRGRTPTGIESKDTKTEEKTVDVAVNDEDTKKE